MTHGPPLPFLQPSFPPPFYTFPSRAADPPNPDFGALRERFRGFEKDVRFGVNVDGESDTSGPGCEWGCGGEGGGGGGGGGEVSVC